MVRAMCEVRGCIHVNVHPIAHFLGIVRQISESTKKHINTNEGEALVIHLVAHKLTHKLTHTSAQRPVTNFFAFQ